MMGRVDHGAGAVRDGAELVDRVGITHALDALLRGPLRGRGSALWVDGGPGSGRTAVVELALARARANGFDTRVARGAGGSCEPIVAAVLAAPGEGRDQQRDPADLEALVRALRSSPGSGPILVAVDDIHRADTPSVRQLGALVTRLSQLPVALLLAGRSLDDEAELTPLLHHPAIRRVPLTRLDVGATRTVLRRTHAAPTAAFVAACHRASGGVPALLALLGDAIRHAGLAADDEGAAQLEPATLGSIPLDEVRRWASTHLTPPDLHLAEAAAVLGDDASIEELCALVELQPEEVLPALDTLIGAELLVPSARITFRAPLLAAALHQGVPFGRRSQLHARAARLLHDRGRGHGAVADHLLATIGIGDDWAIDRLRAAASEARSDRRYVAAASYLRRAIDEPPPPEQRAQLRSELAEATLAAGSPDAVRRAEDAVATACQATRANALQLAAWARYLVGDLDGAIDRIEEAAGCAAPDDPLHDELALLRALVLRWRGAGRTTGARLDPPSSTSGDPLLRVLGGVLTGRELREAQRVALAALGADPTPDSAGPRHEAAILVLLASGGAAAAATELTSHLERSADPARLRWWLAARAEARWRCGALEGALDDARAATAGADGAPLPPYAVAARCWAALALLELDRLDESEAALGPTPVDLGPVVGRWEAVRGRLAAARGEAGAALAAFIRCEQVLVDPGSWEEPSVHWRPFGALAAAAAGQLDRAQAWVDVEVTSARRSGAPIRLGVASWVQGRLAADPEERIRLLADACEQLAAAPSPSLDATRAALDLGAELRRQGRSSLARTQLRGVLDRAHRYGFARLARLAHEELLATGARPRRAALTGPCALTPSETRIARLAASGRSNAEIASLLGLSRKTIEWHLGHVYLKLGVARRTELSTVALPALEPVAGTPG
jgi:DNA-binding CsgD family transcriptional regulator